MKRKQSLIQNKQELLTGIRVLMITIFFLLAIWAVSLEHFDLVIGQNELSMWLTTALITVAPELAGIVVGIVVIDYLNEQRHEEQLKTQLILQMGSPYNDVADSALRLIRSRGWLRDGTLLNAKLDGANLEGADLINAILDGASLRRTRLNKAELKQVSLAEARLTGARLYEAQLQKANLTKAKFKFAHLSKANLTDANLNCTDFSGAIMGGVHLEHADLKGTMFKGAHLSSANLKGAKNWTPEQLLQANLANATMPDNTPYEEWIKQFAGN